MRWIQFGKVFFACALAVTVAACAQYQVRTNKAMGYGAKAERLFAWSAIGEAEPLRKKRLLQSDSFENHFHAALKQAFDKAGVTNDVRTFAPRADKIEDLARFEEDLKPNMRLLIQPARYRTITYQGNTSVSSLWLDLSLYETATNQRIWRGELLLEQGMDPTTWSETGAHNLAAQIIEALKKDRLL